MVEMVQEEIEEQSGRDKGSFRRKRNNKRDAEMDD